MPSRSSETPLVQVTILVEAAAAAVGGSDADLARRLAGFGLDPVNTAKRVARWRKGENAPEYAATLALLRVAGWLDQSAIRRDLAGVEHAEALAGLEQAESLARDQAERQERARGNRKSA